MNRQLMLKLGAIALMIVLLLIPLMMIGNMIGKRQLLRNNVLEDIARSSSFNQRLTGPVLVVPYHKTLREWKVNAANQRELQSSEVTGQLYFLPDSFNVNGAVNTELRARGIYQARLFHARSTINGEFRLPAQLGLGADFADYRFDAPFLAVGISDVRGIESALKLQANDQTLDFQPGSQVPWLGDGLHASLPMLDAREASHVAFAFDLNLQGTGKLEITPVGRSTDVKLSADWPHPSFIGNYLPAERNVTASGFTAQWRTTFFATNLEDALRRCSQDKHCDSWEARSFGVSFIDPVDQYLKSDRAINYALLFISLTFAGFFLFEVLKRIAVHPIQYGLVGMSLALFFLLLLSLAEHMDFALAYGLSASACVLLNGFYLAHVLRSRSNGLGFSLGLGVLYGALYVLLNAEDYGLLMGAILLFGLLGLFMLLTRKLDWYGIGVNGAARAVGEEQ